MDIITFSIIFCVGIVCYTYVGYGLLLLLLVQVKKFFFSPKKIQASKLPKLSFVVAAWNEEEIIAEKIENTLNLNYPKELIQVIFITDGSDDNTPKIVSKHKEILLFHNAERKGKTAAINHAMQFVDSEIVVFSDSNTLLNQDALLLLVRHFADPGVGCVAGEKRIRIPAQANASAAGEGLYWKYESALKALDYALYASTGAAGELFAIRSKLYSPMTEDTILDDFVLSMSIVLKGYRIAYEKNAYALEYASADIHEELKRKVRICAGGFQAMLRLLPLLNVFKHGIFSFQYFSHRVLRWTLAPLALVALIPLNIIASLQQESPLWNCLVVFQIVFYALAFAGWKFEQINIRKSYFFVPFYFTMMNYSVFAGFHQFILGSKQQIWEKAKRQHAEFM